MVVEVMVVPRLPVALPGPTKSITAWPFSPMRHNMSFTFFFFRVRSLFLKDVFQRNKRFDCEADVSLCLMPPVEKVPGSS